eukprot:352622-Pelagomonas_calceolata.AAC.1
MPTNSSPGFDIISPAFIKNAYKRVPRHQGRGTERSCTGTTYNFLLPLTSSKSACPKCMEGSQAYSHS